MDIENLKKCENSHFSNDYDFFYKSIDDKKIRKY